MECITKKEDTLNKGVDAMPVNRRNPMEFQGNVNKRNYFEGWYYKQVSQHGKIILALIPGISLFDRDKHSFIQYILSYTDDKGEKNLVTGYVRYPVEAFTYQKDPFKVKVGKSIFTEKKIFLDLKDQHRYFQGTLEIHPFTPIPTGLFAPSIMGPFAYFPGMECNHGVVSMNHDIMGTIQMNDQSLKFNYGRGYIEKDWGSSFPEEYIWMQCNTFDIPETSLFFSIAHIPFLGRSFQGHIGNLLLKKKQYRFATYNGTKISTLQRRGKEISVVAENKEARLALTAIPDQERELIAPVRGKMERVIKEGITGTVTFELLDKKTGETHRDRGKAAGIEVVVEEKRRNKKLRIEEVAPEDEGLESKEEDSVST